MTSVYPQWITNIVPVPKKYGKVLMCVDYRDLNKASLKDDFPLLHIDILVESHQSVKCSRAWMDFLDTIKLRWLLRTWKKQRLPHPGEHSVIE